MRRFIRYLYEYEEEKKMRNVGFVKVEWDVEQCVIHVHGKGFRMEEHTQGLEVYLFWKREGKCIGINQGVTEPPAPGLNYQLCYTPEDMGKKENYDLVNGIILKDGNGHWYAAVWNDDVVNVCRMMNWEMAEEEEESAEVPVREDEECNLKTKDREGEEKRVEDSGEQEEKHSTGSSGDIDSGTYKVNNSVKNGYKVRKIQRKDMVCLPRCEWKHANNSFLVHGYYNYHHLILTACDGQLKLGVPGIYHPQEARAAQSFGFPEFLPASELELTLTEEEKNDRETFGYWCRNVRGPVSCAEV